MKKSESCAVRGFASESGTLRRLYAWAHTGWGDSIILTVMCATWLILGWRFAWLLWAAGWR